MRSYAYALALGSSLVLPSIAQVLPAVSSGNLVAHFRADDSFVARGALDEVATWTAVNDPSIVLTSIGNNPQGISYGATRMNGRPSLVFSDGVGFDQQLAGTLPTGLNLTTATIFWLGYYSVDPDTQGRYAYSIGTDAGFGATQMTHQRDDGIGDFRIELYNGHVNNFGDRIDRYEEQFRIWRTIYRGAASPGRRHSPFVDGMLLGVGNNAYGYDVSPDPHPIHIGGWQGQGFNFDGEMSELLIYAGELDAIDLAAVETYLSQRRNGQLGAPYCTAVTNGSGDRARCRATGSRQVARNDVRLACLLTSNNAHGYFITSTAQAFVHEPAGSFGNLCLGGAVGRFTSSVFNTGGAGGAHQRIDLTTMPSPTGPVAVQPGETWYFQAWFRDTLAGVTKSNFTDGLAITFL